MDIILIIEYALSAMKPALCAVEENGISVLHAIQVIILSLLLCAYNARICVLIAAINIIALLVSLIEWDNYVIAKCNMLLIIHQGLHGAVLAR